MQNLCWNDKVSAIRSIGKVPFNDFFYVIKVCQTFYVLGHKQQRLRNGYDIPHPHVQLPSTLCGWFINREQATVVAFVGMKSVAFSGNRKVLTWKSSRYNINVIREDMFTRFSQFYKVNDAVQMIYLLSIAHVFRKIGYPGGLCRQPDIICKYSMKTCLLQRNPVVILFCYPVWMQRCID